MSRAVGIVTLLGNLLFLGASVTIAISIDQTLWYVLIAPIPLMAGFGVVATCIALVRHRKDL